MAQSDFRSFYISIAATAEYKFHVEANKKLEKFLSHRKWKSDCILQYEKRGSERNEDVSCMYFGARKKRFHFIYSAMIGMFSTLEQRIRKISYYGVHCKLCHMLKLLLLNFMCRKTIIEVWHNLQTTPKSFSEQKVPHRCEDKLLLLLLPSKHSKLPKETRSE